MSNDPKAAFARERFLARREGLWTQSETMRAALQTDENDNAAPLVREAIRQDRERKVRLGQMADAVRRILEGKPGLWDEAAARADDLSVWRAASRRSQLNFDRDWELGPALICPALSEIKGAANRLCASAFVGAEPEESFGAAVRLANLVAQEPTLLARAASRSIVKIAHRSAARQGVSLSGIRRSSIQPLLRPAHVFPKRRKVAVYVGKGWRKIGARPMSPDLYASHAMRLLRLHRKLWRAVSAAHGDPDREKAALVAYASGPGRYIDDHRLFGAGPLDSRSALAVAQSLVDMEPSRLSFGSGAER